MQSSIVIVLLLCCQAVFSIQGTGGISRTDWQYCRGPNTFTPNPDTSQSQHGDVGEYVAATVPTVGDSCWSPCDDSYCTDPQTISIDAVSRLPGCWSLLDFTYLQTFITIGEGVDVESFTVNFTQMDDGSRISIYNPDYVQGLVLLDSYVFLSQTASVNMASYLSAGVTRLVITQVDDCAVANHITCDVSFNGEFIPTTCVAPDACHIATLVGASCDLSVAPDGTACDDSNACTQTDTCQSGVCTGGNPVECAASAQCPGTTEASCDPTTGTCAAPQRRSGVFTENRAVLSLYLRDKIN